MRIEIDLSDEFGAHLANGVLAAEYRRTRIEPYVDLYQEIILDFTKVRNANSSFVNALIAGIVEQHGKKVLEKLTFKGCNPVVRVLVEGAINLGLQKSAGRIDA
jgi:hypothetical protein